MADDDKLTVEQWLAIRKEEALKIDPVEAGRAANMQQGCCKDAAKMQTGLAENSQNLEAEREQEIEEEVGLQGRSNRRGGDNVIHWRRCAAPKRTEPPEGWSREFAQDLDDEIPFGECRR